MRSWVRWWSDTCKMQKYSFWLHTQVSCELEKYEIGERAVSLKQRAFAQQRGDLVEGVEA